jgi:hypothetical protein
MVRIHARVTGTQDTDRPLILSMTPDEARELAARLVDKAETIELANGPKWAPAPEGEKSQHGA